MKTVRVSLTVGEELHTEMLGYCAGVDRTVQNFLIHAARQYMRRYPLAGQQRGKRDGMVPKDDLAPQSRLQLQDCSPEGKETGGQ